MNLRIPAHILQAVHRIHMSFAAHKLAHCLLGLPDGNGMLYPISCEHARVDVAFGLEDILIGTAGKV
eukprot:CAMPEP_0181076814 /NCGR_PEP_ID=MMETSP1071-20121207/617_1 /TAXON_ID=35127 /ORGANISM="Thalassiosira sp., Strain NH16" /LENGTH=66 /DNA_ID=CAMNT_0023158015 /DNA_START=172 /DNA_END=372 /DNA_ORIENTATION=-